MLKILIGFSLLLSPFFLQAENAVWRLSLGPEYYHVKRTKPHGTKQEGTLLGGRARIERFKRYGWYVGAEGASARGDLNGHTGSAVKIRSRLIDWSVEGRLGYTFQCKTGWRAALTPYAGGGWYVEKNNFKSPSPLHVHFRTRYAFAGFGLLSALYPTECTMVGLNWKGRYPLSPKCRVTHDMNEEPMTQRIGDRVQYRIELPLVYRLERLALSLEPFYESRTYGSHPNYPFNYIRTKFVEMGAALYFQYWW